MKLIVPAVIIGLVGGILDEVTDLNKVWCFLIGVVAFIIFLFIKSVFCIIFSKFALKLSELQCYISEITSQS